MREACSTCAVENSRVASVSRVPCAYHVRFIAR